MKVSTCLLLIICIWSSAAALTAPYGIFMDLMEDDRGEMFCEEDFSILFYHYMFLQVE
jgi:hypothetical protein